MNNSNIYIFKYNGSLGNVEIYCNFKELMELLKFFASSYADIEGTINVDTKIYIPLNSGV